MGKKKKMNKHVVTSFILLNTPEFQNKVLVVVSQYIFPAWQF